MRGWRRALLLLVTGLGFMLIGLASAAPASAHAALVATDPADGAHLSKAPATVTFTFAEGASLGEGGYVRVINQHGTVISTSAAFHPKDAAHAEGDPAKIAAALPVELAQGTYLASYRIVSEDSHPVAGSIRFVIGNGDLADVETSGQSIAPAVKWLYDATRDIGYLGLSLLGGGWLLLRVWPQGRTDRRARGVLWSGWTATVFATCSQLLLQGPYAAGRGATDAVNATLLNETLHSLVGAADAVRLLLLAALAVILGQFLDSERPTKLGQFGALLFVGTAVTVILAGHAYAQDPRWLALSSHTLHLLAISVWLGGLAMLLFAVLRSGAEPEGAVLRWFTPVAYVCVAVIVLTGTYQAWLGVGSWHALVTTTYGQLVIAKIVGLLGMLGLAYFSRLFAARAVTSPEKTLVQKLRRGVLVEAVIGVVVLTLTAVLVAEPPGRSVAAAALAQQATTVQINMTPQGATIQRSASLTVRPSRAGSVELSLALDKGWPSSHHGGTKVSLQAQQPAKKVGPITVDLLAQSGGANYAASTTLPVPGQWTFTVRVQTSEFDAVTAEAQVSLR